MSTWYKEMPLYHYMYITYKAQHWHKFKPDISEVQYKVKFAIQMDPNDYVCLRTQGQKACSYSSNPMQGSLLR